MFSEMSSVHNLNVTEIWSDSFCQHHLKLNLLISFQRSVKSNFEIVLTNNKEFLKYIYVRLGAVDYPLGQQFARFGLSFKKIV